MQRYKKKLEYTYGAGELLGLDDCSLDMKIAQMGSTLTYFPFQLLIKSRRYHLITRNYFLLEGVRCGLDMKIAQMGST